MDGKKIFRTSIFGGFKKKDVEAYVDMLEEEVQKMQNERDQGFTDTDRKVIEESIEEIRNLKDEKERLESHVEKLERQLKEVSEQRDVVYVPDLEMKEKIDGLIRENEQLKEDLARMNPEEDREMIRRILSDARRQAAEIVQKAENDANMRDELARQDLKTELENKIIDFIVENYRLENYTKEIDNICRQLKDVSNSLRNVHLDVPDRVENLIQRAESKMKESNQKSIENSNREFDF